MRVCVSAFEAKAGRNAPKFGSNPGFHSFARNFVSLELVNHGDAQMLRMLSKFACCHAFKIAFGIEKKRRNQRKQPQTVVS